MNQQAELQNQRQPVHTDRVRTISRSKRVVSDDDAVALANALRPVILQLGRHLRRELHSLGVTGGQASMLAAIQSCPGIGVKELAEREGISAPSVTVQIDRLEAAGLAERVRTPGADGRRVALKVTAEGSRVLRTIRSRRTAWLASRLMTLDAEDRKRLSAAADALTLLVPSTASK